MGSSSRKEFDLNVSRAEWNGESWEKAPLGNVDLFTGSRADNTSKQKEADDGR